QGHEPIHRRLELNEEKDVNRAAAERDLPQDVRLALAEIVGHIAGRKPLQSSEVEVIDKVLRHKGTHEQFHHSWMREQLLVTAIAELLLVHVSIVWHRAPSRKTSRPARRPVPTGPGSFSVAALRSASELSLPGSAVRHRGSHLPDRSDRRARGARR